MAESKKNYYDILGVSKKASSDEIKSAYRRLAKQYHPDLHPGDAAAAEKFKEINEAYEVLSDADKKARYDQYGFAGVDPNFNPDEWVMGCKSSDIRRSSALFGEYMPITSTQPIGLSDMSVQQGHCTMYASEVVNPDSVVGGKILGTF